MSLCVAAGCALLSGAVGAASAAEFLLPVGVGAWEGAAAETAATAGTPSAVRWEFGKSRYVKLSKTPSDWSSYSCLAFDLVCSKATDTRVYVIVASEDPETDGMDYYNLRLTLTHAGRHSFQIPFSEMQCTRSPVGWQRIDYIQFHNTWGSSDSPDPEQVITVENARLTAGNLTAEGKGPRLSDERFFADLDLGRPGLEKVKAAHAAGDFGTARHEFAEYLRARREPKWFINPDHRPTRGIAPRASDDGKARGGQFRARFKVDWVGWRKVRLEKSAFRGAGKPVGWAWVSKLDVTWRTRDGDESRVLHIDDCRLTGPGVDCVIGEFEDECSGWDGASISREEAHSGRSSGKWWFPSINQRLVCNRAPADWSGVDALELWVHSNEAAPKDLLVTVHSRLPDTRRADTILTHKFVIGGFKDHVYDFGERIDWSCNAMTEGESRTVEWNAQLNRHFHFKYLYNAYWATGDQKYARELAREMNAWVEDNPVLLFRSGNNPYHHAWETLNTGIRIHSTWPNTLYSCWDSPEFTDDILINIVKSMVEQARHLIKHPSKCNWLTAESLGVYTVGVLFPEFRDAPEWRRLAVDRIYSQLSEEVYPGGLQIELALGYNCWVLSEFIQVVQLARLNGLVGELPNDYLAKVEKMYEYLMKDSMGDGKAFGLNDSGNTNTKGRLITGYGHYPHREDFIYAVSNGELGARPARDSYAMPYIGHYVQRSGWDRDARALHLDAGRFGAGHQHEDKLTVAMYAYGKLLLPDGGNFMYDRSRWRAYVLLSRAHNTVLVDGMDQFRRRSRDLRIWPRPWDKPTPEGDDARWYSVPDMDVVVGWYRHSYREYLDYQLKKKDPKTLDTVQHRRAIMFVKPDFWIVQDSLTATDDAEHTCDVIYHVNGDDIEVNPLSLQATSVASEGARLTICPLRSDGLSVNVVKGKIDPPIQGWTRVVSGPKGDHPMTPIPTAIYSRAWRRNTDIVTVLSPFPEGAEAPVTSCTAHEAPEGVLAATIALKDGSRHMYVANSAPGRETTVGAVTTDAEFADACGGEGRAFRLLFANGTQLSVGGVSVSLSTSGSAAVRGIAPGLYTAGSDRDGDMTLVLPQALALSTVKVYALDKDSKRTEAIAANSADGRLSFTAKANVRYEISDGGPSLKELLEHRTRERAQAPVPGLDLPVKALAPQPLSTGVRIVVQAEDMAAQGGGQVTVTDRKVGSDGKAFLHWDDPGHYLDYALDVPRDGAYFLTLRYCTGTEGPIRAVSVDGAFPAEELKSIEFDWTGGWANQTDDWANKTIPDSRTGEPFLFHLTAGRHVVRLASVRDSMNLDYLVLHSPDCPVP